MGLKLDGPQRRYEALMFDPEDADHCRITRDIEGTDDDTLNPSSLALVPPAGDKITVYEGPCVLGDASGSLGTAEKPLAEGGVSQWVRHYTLKIPKSAAVPRAADEVTMLVSRNPAQVGLVLRVIGPTFGTHKLYLAVQVEARSGGT